MKVILPVFAAAALLGVFAIAQACAQGKGPPPPQKADPAAIERAERRKATDAEYEKAVKRIPDSNDKPDPWKGVRGK